MTQCSQVVSVAGAGVAGAGCGWQADKRRAALLPSSSMSWLPRCLLLPSRFPYYYHCSQFTDR